MTTTRREFLATSALTLSAASYGRAADKPNEKVRLAVMGLRTRGKQLAPGFAALPGVEISHLVDVDPAMVKPTLDALKNPEVSPQIETDIRKVLEDKSVTAVVVSAPDHWHALAAIWAAERGKHVYVEKPVSHNLIEGRRMVQAARKYKVVMQAGTQRRSSTNVVAAREYVKAGNSERWRSRGRGSRAAAKLLARGRTSRTRRRASITTCSWGRRRRGRSTPTASITTGTGSGKPAPARSGTTASTAST